MNEKYRETLGSLLYEIIAMQALLDKELSQDWKTYTITINDETHELNPECEPAIRSMVIKTLLKDAISSYIDDVLSNESSFKVITQILEGSRKEDHQFKIIKEEIVTNLDENGNPITAKPLNDESVYVQWQNMKKFSFFGGLTEEEIREAYEKIGKKFQRMGPINSLEDYHNIKWTDDERDEIKREIEALEERIKESRKEQVFKENQ